MQKNGKKSKATFLAPPKKKQETSSSEDDSSEEEVCSTETNYGLVTLVIVYIFVFS